MVYEAEVKARVYISVEEGGEEAARRIVRDHVANGWVLGYADGTALDAGRFVVKGLSAEVGTIVPFRMNGRVSKSAEGAEEDL